MGDRNRSRGRIKKLYIITNNKQSKYIYFFFGGGGCGGRYRAAFQHVAGQSKAAKINKYIKSGKENLIYAGLTGLGPQDRGQGRGTGKEEFVSID